MPTRFGFAVLMVVAAGGAAGTLLRAWAEYAWPPGGGFPWATLVVNMAGAAVLGFLVALPAGPGRGSRHAHLLVGAGFCGGLTTFSTLAVEADLFVKSGHVATALGYLALTVAGGLAAARTGMVLARSG